MDILETDTHRRRLAHRGPSRRLIRVRVVNMPLEQSTASVLIISPELRKLQLAPLRPSPSAPR